MNRETAVLVALAALAVAAALASAAAWINLWRDLRARRRRPPDETGPDEAAPDEERRAAEGPTSPRP